MTCAGITLSEREISALHRHEEDAPEKNNEREYEFVLSPELLKTTAPVIDSWYKKAKRFSPLRLSVQFQYGVTMERELHRITTSVFNTELSISGKDSFEFGKHWFELKCHQNSWHPVFEMAVWKKFASIPFEEIFTSLVKRQIFIIEKPLIKEIWVKPD